VIGSTYYSKTVRQPSIGELDPGKLTLSSCLNLDQQTHECEEDQPN
jgi:hypothetical protein